MEANPNVAMLYADLPARTGWRFYGQATVFKEGQMRQKIIERTIKDELDRDPERKGYGVLVRVDKIRRYSGDEVSSDRTNTKVRAEISPVERDEEGRLCRLRSSP